MKMEGKRKLKKCLSGCIKELSPSEIDKYIELRGDLDKVFHKTTILCEASRKGMLETVQKLLDSGANVNTPDANGCSPLYIAASHGHVSLVEALLKSEADMEKKNNNGFNPLVSCLQNTHNECATLLIENGACVNSESPRNRYGEAVSLLTNILIVKGDWEMAETLLQAGIKPMRFIPPFCLILLEDPTTPVGLIRKFVYAGFDVQVKGWVDIATRRGSDLTTTQRQLVQLIEEDRKCVPCLQRLSRTVIRGCLADQGASSVMHLSKKINLLPLPNDVKKYLNLEYL